jgi:tRNA-Thr(GGU) m(6)t(6)A37 methyltransferase TsaA
MERFTMQPIGVIHTPFTQREGIPIQGALAPQVTGEIEVFPEFEEGLKDTEGFSHLILIYVFHTSQGYSLHAKPFLDDITRGVFAIRSPRRPNPIGLTVVRLLERRGRFLDIAGVDMLEGTPLLDIKPYIPHIDSFSHAKTGWCEGKMKRGETRLSDDRFTSAERAEENTS